MKYPYICRECSKSFEVAEENVRFKRPLTIDGCEYYVTYFDCPGCAKRVYSQVDDNETIRLVKEIEQMLAKSMPTKQMSQMEHSQFSRAKGNLRRRRNGLKAAISGKTVILDGKMDKVKILLTK